MAMNFAPYQSSPPESERAKSPPPLRSPTSSPKPNQQSRPTHTRNISSVTATSDPWAAARNQRLPSPSHYADSETSPSGYQDISDEGPRPYNPNPYNDYITPNLPSPSTGPDVFQTSLNLPLKIEAALAYLLLPPAGGVILLLFEHKSDYVRFHAWQSSLTFSTLFLIHIIFSWTAIVSYMLLAFDLLLIGYLVLGAWRNADTLDRVEVPVFGRLASGFVDDE